MKILITGCAGFIGYHLTKESLKIRNIKSMELIILILTTM